MKKELKELTVREMAKLGGHARAKSLSSAERRRIAKKAIATRWAKRKKDGAK